MLYLLLDLYTAVKIVSRIAAVCIILGKSKPFLGVCGIQKFSLPK